MKGIYESIVKITEGFRMHKNARTIYRNIQYNNCLDYCIPTKYSIQFNIKKTSLLSGLLEAYHQERLKDEL